MAVEFISLYDAIWTMGKLGSSPFTNFGMGNRSRVKPNREPFVGKRKSRGNFLIAKLVRREAPNGRLDRQIKHYSLAIFPDPFSVSTTAIVTSHTFTGSDFLAESSSRR